MVREEDDTLEDDDEDEEGSDRRSRAARRRSRSASRSSRSKPVRRWRADADEDEEGEEVEPPPARRSFLRREAHPVYWRARDSLYFEPLVAVAVIVVLLVGLYAFTGNWPPVYVVESESMQHGYTDVLGLINTGDLVLAQKVPMSDITPYVVGLKTGYQTYGEYGDVLLYYPNGQAGTPIIHRAIVYLQWDPANATWSAPELLGLPCGSSPTAVYDTSVGNGCGVVGMTGVLHLYHIGWRSATVNYTLPGPAPNQQSGYLTMGDNNFYVLPCTYCVGEPDQPLLSSLVQPGWIVGVARGMLPWFGALKLLLEGNAGEVPPQSWQFLGITIVGLILLAFGIHYALRAEGIEDPRRKREEEADRDVGEEEDEPAASRGRRFLRSLRPWRRAEEEDEEDELTPRRSTKPARGTSRRGRPRPQVRRGEKSKRASRDKDDDDL